MKKYYSLFPLLFFIVLSCQKDETFDPKNQSPAADFTYEDNIDHFSLTDNSTDPESDILKISWSSNSDLIQFSSYSGSVTSFDIPDLTETFTVDITETVSDGNSESVIIKSIALPLLTETRKWGLGKKLDAEKSNNVNYDWYIDQMNTGTYSSVNCGPSSVTMAIKWADESFNNTAEDARNTYRPEGGWWYTSDIINYLNKYSIPNYTIDLPDIEKVTREIDNGNIAILCLDMFYISNEAKDEWRIHKFYKTNSEGWGHFIVVKGYKVVDGETLFECYDPYSFGKKYEDNNLKGLNRYYASSDIDQATEIWWDYAIIISKNTLKNAAGIDSNKIPHQSGK